MTSGQRDDRCSLGSDLQLAQALTRRALAFDLVGACTFAVMEKWHRFLFAQMAIAPPANYQGITLEQLIRTDKHAWVRMAELVQSIKRKPDGSKPLDGAINLLPNDPSVMFHLMPLPSHAVRISTVEKRKAEREPNVSEAQRKRERQNEDKFWGHAAGVARHEVKHHVRRTHLLELQHGQGL